MLLLLLLLHLLRSLMNLTKSRPPWHVHGLLRCGHLLHRPGCRWRRLLRRHRRAKQIHGLVGVAAMLNVGQGHCGQLQHQPQGVDGAISVRHLLDAHVNALHD